MKRRNIAVGLGIVTIAAVVLLVPMVPFSFAVGTGTTYPMNTLPTMRCVVPDSVVNPTIVYKGYESMVYYFTGVGFRFNTNCYMP